MDVQKEKKQHRKKAPKQPLSPYVHFINDRQVAVRKESPNMSFADISKTIASEWSKIKEEEKQKYVKKADLDKERYDLEYQKYQRTDVCNENEKVSGKIVEKAKKSSKKLKKVVKSTIDNKRGKKSAKPTQKQKRPAKQISDTKAASEPENSIRKSTRKRKSPSWKFKDFELEDSDIHDKTCSAVEEQAKVKNQNFHSKNISKDEFNSSIDSRGSGEHLEIDSSAGKS